ncbi:hypothetical protein BC826DRAFT_74140 [Russula brevipes]|nr:hypothetical protein BC826DRAFT_74140 [Russula brevipes]
MMMSTATTSPRRPHPEPSSPNDSRRTRPPKQPSNRNRNHNDHPMHRPTHFLTLPIGHHPLRSAISALKPSWLAHDPPIDGLDPSIVVQPRRLHLTPGIMALTPLPPDRNSNDDGDGDGERDLTGTTALLATLALRIRAVLAHSPLRVPLWPACRHAVGPCVRTCALPRAGPPLSG